MKKIRNTTKAFGNTNGQCWKNADRGFWRCQVVQKCVQVARAHPYGRGRSGTRGATNSPVDQDCSSSVSASLPKPRFLILFCLGSTRRYHNFKNKFQKPSRKSRGKSEYFKGKLKGQFFARVFAKNAAMVRTRIASGFAIEFQKNNLKKSEPFSGLNSRHMVVAS